MISTISLTQAGRGVSEAAPTHGDLFHGALCGSKESVKQRHYEDGIDLGHSWNNLPVEIKRLVLLAGNEIGGVKLPFVDKTTLAIAMGTPELKWRQRELMTAIEGKNEGELVLALEAHQQPFRCRLESIKLPSTTSLICLKSIAGLLKGGRQRPYMLFKYGSAPSSDDTPVEIEVRKETFAQSLAQEAFVTFNHRPATFQEIMLFERIL